MNKEKGFGAIGIILVLLVMAIIGFAVWRVWANSQSGQNTPTQQNQSPAQAVTPTIPSGFKEYKDTKNRFSFFFPESWEIKQNQNSGALVSLIRPSLKEKITKGTGAPSGQYFYEGSQFSLVVSHWNNVNNVIEDEFSGKRQYSGLADFINDPQVPVKKIGEISINGAQGYDVINPGVSTQYAILFERPDGIYQFEFSDVPAKDSLGSEDKKIVETIKFN